MAADQYEALIELGPFRGVDYTSSDPTVQPGFAASATNANTSIVTDALTTELGRVLLYDFAAELDSISVVVPVTFGVFGTNSFGGYVVGGLSGTTFKAYIYSTFLSPNVSQITLIANANAFDQAVQYGGVLYTNGGQRMFCNNAAGVVLLPTMYAWQYPPPDSVGNITLSDAGVVASVDTASTTPVTTTGSLVTITPVSMTGITTGELLIMDTGPQQEHVSIGTTTATTFDAIFGKPHNSGFKISSGLAIAQYFYVTTTVTTMPDGTISESSVNLGQFSSPPSISLTDAGHGINITPINGYAWSGTHSLDGLPYTTNLYRQSSLQPTYTLVAPLSGTATYLDIAPDSALLGNVQLQPQRDQPPTVPGSYGTASGSFNFAAITVHKNRVWVYANVQTSSTNNFPQNQLWYSNLGRPWEFNQLTQVLLMQAAETTQYASVPNYGTTYDDFNGDDPLALAEAGTWLMGHARRELWAVTGDNAATFLQRDIINIGTVSRHAVTPANGGIFWLSENGAYYFDGSVPKYISEQLRGLLNATPNSPALTPAQLSTATGAFAKMTWYLSFPALDKTFGYFTVSGLWLGELDYAPSSPGGLAFTPARPAQYVAEGGGQGMNEVVAARHAGTQVDYWFVDPNDDLGSPQTFAWSGPFSESKKPSYEKQYRFVTLHVPPGTFGSAVVTLTVDSQTPIAWTIPDLSQQTRFIKSLGTNGDLVRGFMARLSLSVTGAASKSAPQIWNAIVWGQTPPDRNLVMRV